MKLTAKEYYKLTPKEFYHALDDHNKEKEESRKTVMEAARLVSMHVWNASGRVLKDVILDPAEFDMIKFVWDGERQVKKQSVEEQKQVMMGIALKMNKGKNKN